LDFFLPLYDTSFCLYVLVFWTGNFCGIFWNFSGIFLLNFIKNTLGLGQFRILTGQMMEFLVYLSHDEESQSHDSHHMFFYLLYLWHRFLVRLAYSWKRSCGLIAQ